MKTISCWISVLFLFLFIPQIFAAETIKVGAIYSKTGEAKAISDEHLITARFAVSEINKNGGVLGRQIELIEFDNESSGLGSRNAARLAVASGVVAVLGPSWSSHALAVAPVLQEAGISMLTPTATNPKVTEVGDCIFRICFVDSFQAGMLAKFMREDLHTATVLVLVNTKHLYSIDLAEMFTTKFQELGGTVVRKVEYSEDITDYRTMFESIDDISYEAVFIPGYSRDAAQIIKTAAEMSIRTIFVGGDGWSHLMFDYAGDTLNGSYYLTHWGKTMQNKESLEFVSKISQLIDYDKINAGMALSYDTVYLLVDAIKRANSDRPAAIREALAATIGFAGIAGTVRFDELRNPVKPAVIHRFQDGQTFVFKKVEP